MERKELAERIWKTSHLSGDFLLRSGTISHEYFDKYQFESRPLLLKEIAKQMVELLPKEFDAMAALEVGGIPIGTALSLATNKPIVFVRKKAKDYGTRKFAEGPEIKNQKLVVIEDVVTSGGQIIISTDDLRKAGAFVTTALCVIDREAGGREKLAEKGIELVALFKMSELKDLVGV